MRRFSLSPPRLAFLAWWFWRPLAFRSLYYPWGKMETTRSLPDDDRIVSHDAPRFMLYYHCVRDTSLSVIFSTREVNVDHSARCGWFPNKFRFSSFCFWDYRVGLYSLSFEGEFQRYFDQEGFYMYFTDLSRTPLCTRLHCKHKA